MTVVNCEETSCRFNKNENDRYASGVCSKNEINLTSDLESMDCEDYKGG